MTDERQSQHEHPSPRPGTTSQPLWMRMSAKRQAVRTIPLADGQHVPVEPPSVDRSLWVHEPDEQQLRTMSREALKSYSRPLSGPLAPVSSKSRFSRWRSMIIFGAVVILAILAVIAAVRFGQITIEVIKLLKPVPTPAPLGTPAH